MKSNSSLIIVISLVTIGLLVGSIFLFSRFIQPTNVASSQFVEVSQLVSDEPLVYGNPEAAVTIVEFSDFQCPACAVSAPEIKRVIDENNGKVKLVYRHFPLPIHQNAQLAAQAGEAAHKQGKFWEMHDLLFARQGDWDDLGNPEDTFVSYAQELQLNVDQFKADLKSPETEKRVLQDLTVGNQARVQATPTFFVNGYKVLGVTSPEFRQYLVQELQKTQ